MTWRSLTPRCRVQRVQWSTLRTGGTAHDPAQIHESPVREIVLPSGARAHVIDAPDMPRGAMQRCARAIGAHPALSWLASHSKALHR